MTETRSKPAATRPLHRHATRTEAERPPRRRPRTPYPHLFRLLHWVVPASMVVALLTGLSLHASARPGWSLFEGVVPGYFWQGQVHLVHLSAAVVFSASVVAVVWVYSRRKVRRRVTHLTLLGGGLAMLLSGLLLVSPVGPSWLFWTARAIHATSGLVVLPLALGWHVVDGLGRFRRALIPAFRPLASPRWMQLVCFLPLPLLSACLILSFLPPSATGRELVAKRVVANEGNLESLPWGDAPPLQIELANGVGFDEGRTSVTLRALHNGHELFVLAEWLDPTEDRQYLPWERTADGWRRLVTNLEDEVAYYEDKFALIFPAETDRRFPRFGCAAYCHLGGDRPYGYKGSDHLVDVWHWKAVRTDPVGQVDDKYWLGLDLTAEDVGRHGDPKRAGGYTKEPTENTAQPSFLPDELASIKQGGIPQQHAVDYSEEAAQRIPPGTLVPGVIVSAFVGDRGDVRCQSRYEAGRWHLWIRRRLDTGSQYDRRLVPGASHPFGCAAFDHTSNRHAYGLAVYRLTLEP